MSAKKANGIATVDAASHGFWLQFGDSRGCRGIV